MNTAVTALKAKKIEALGRLTYEPVYRPFGSNFEEIHSVFARNNSEIQIQIGWSEIKFLRGKTDG
jgi:hypothetical protein